MRVFGTIPKELYDWLQKQIETGKYHNMSHAIEVALKLLREKEKT
jgi:Arc/MetJ-type ribon-helix-helix transcriptional regulator